MPGEYHIDPVRRLIVSRFWGPLALDEYVEWRRKVAADPAFDPTYRGLMDLSEVTTVNVTTPELQYLGATPILEAGAPIAVVATSPLIYGLVRMVQAYRELRGAPLEVFEDRASADQWLELRARPDSRPPAEGA
jgi:hypothetical protein